MIKSIIHNPASFVSKSVDFNKMIEKRKARPRRILSKLTSQEIHNNRYLNKRNTGLSDYQE